MKINIHVGVHKTATTFMQNTLLANRAALHAAGIGYQHLWDLRAAFTEKLMELTPENFKIEDHLPKFFDGKVPSEVHGLVISDENLIGYCGGLLMSGQPFANAGGRLGHLRQLLKGHEITLFCAIRSYDTFLSSAYCEGIRNTNKFVPFQVFQNRLKWDKMQWPLLLQAFEQNLQPDKTLFWRYEDFRENSDLVFDALTFYAGIKMLKPSGRSVEYPSFSKTAVETLDVLSKNFGSGIVNRLITAVGDVFPKGEQYPGLEPWSPSEAALLKKLYREDCASIEPNKRLIHDRPQDKQNAAA